MTSAYKPSILTEAGQRTLHEENQRSIDDLRQRIDRVIEQNEALLVALRTIIGGPIDNIETLLRFRDEHQRFIRYDRRITLAAESIAVWAIRGALVGITVSMAWGLGAMGAFGLFKDWIK